MNRLLVVFLMMPFLMGLNLQGEEDEGGMGGTGHSRGVPLDLPGTPEVPEIIDHIPEVIDSGNGFDFSDVTEAAGDVDEVDTISIDVDVIEGAEEIGIDK